MTAKLMSSVLFVRDMAASRAFYEGLLGQKVTMDHGPNVGFEGGFAIWQAGHAETVVFGHELERPARLGCDNLELYFETEAMDELWSRVQAGAIAVVHAIREQPWGQRVFRVYDPDGHLVEVGEPLPVVVARFLSQGLDTGAIAQRMAIPEAVIRQMAGMAG